MRRPPRSRLLARRVHLTPRTQSLAQGHPGLIYRLLFNAASKTLLEFGRNPRWLGGELAITMVLHTWGQNLRQHIHVHCLVTDGALSLDRARWLTPPRRGFLFPTAALSKVFRGKNLHALTTAHRTGELHMPGDEDLDDTRAFEAARWRIELIFKELKSHYRLDELPTRKTPIVETLLLGAVITLLINQSPAAPCREATIATHLILDARTALGCHLYRRRASDTRYRAAATEGIEGDCPTPRIDAPPRGIRPQSVAATAHRTRPTRCRMGMIPCNSIC